MNAPPLQPEAIAWLQERWGSAAPDVGVVLGSGIQLLDDDFHEEDRVCVSEIPSLPEPTVEGHGGYWIRYRFGEKKILVVGGRVHLYEGYAADEVTMGVRVLAGLGTSSLLLTNAAGGIREGFTPGMVVAISDHIQLQGVSAMMATLEQHVESDRLSIYDSAWLDRTRTRYQMSCTDSLQQGTYAALTGPTYETPTEIVMLRKFGADLVGMSTVLEALAARDAGMKVLGFSLVTNLAAGISGKKLNHQEVLDVGKNSQKRMLQIVRAAIESID